MRTLAKVRTVLGRTPVVSAEQALAGSPVSTLGELQPYRAASCKDLPVTVRQPHHRRRPEYLSKRVINAGAAGHFQSKGDFPPCSD